MMNRLGRIVVVAGRGRSEFCRAPGIEEGFRPAFAGRPAAALAASPAASRDRLSPGAAAALGVLGGLAVGGAIAAAQGPVYAAPAPVYVERERPVFVQPAPMYAAPMYSQPGPSGLNLNFNIPLN